jgi:hypothetical protein
MSVTTLSKRSGCVSSHSGGTVDNSETRVDQVFRETTRLKRSGKTVPQLALSIWKGVRIYELKLDG